MIQKQEQNQIMSGPWAIGTPCRVVYSLPNHLLLSRIWPPASLLSLPSPTRSSTQCCARDHPPPSSSWPWMTKGYGRWQGLLCFLFSQASQKCPISHTPHLLLITLLTLCIRLNSSPSKLHAFCIGLWGTFIRNVKFLNAEDLFRYCFHVVGKGMLFFSGEIKCLLPRKVFWTINNNLRFKHDPGPKR